MSLSELKLVTESNTPHFTLQGRDFISKITSIYDADTITAAIILEKKITQFKVRLIGIDTPEMRPSKKKPNRNKEKTAAKRARNRLIQLVTDIDISLDEMGGTKKCQKMVKSCKKCEKWFPPF